MRNFGPHFALVTFLTVFHGAGCSSSEEAPDLGLPKTKNLSELKQASNNDMSKEELEEARRQAGFRSPEEQRAEALAEYVKSEKAFVKGRLKSFRKLTQDVRKRLSIIEKAAPTWRKAKKPDAAFAKFKDNTKDGDKALLDAYDELTEKGSRGGDTIAELDKGIRGWQELNQQLSPQVAEDEGFPAVLAAIREQLDAVDATFKDIENDESIEADPPSP